LSQLPEDPVRQRTIIPSTAVVGLNFEGLGDGEYGFHVNSTPPDTEGAVGATQYIQWVNDSFAVFDKATGGLIAGPADGNILWSGFGGGCETDNDGDPIALYDKLANRWVLSQFAVSSPPPYLQCIAVSVTSDATGYWYRYSFEYSNFDDYPKMGVWPDGYYETFNMFQNNQFIGSNLCAYDRISMLSGLSAIQVCFQENTSVFGVLPADVDGTTAPPAGSPNYMMAYGANSLDLYKFHVDFNNPNNSTLSGPTVINVAPFTPLCNGGICVPQPGTTNTLDSLASRLMYRLAYRNFGSHESLVVNHSVAVNGGASGGVRWYEVQNPSGTPVLAQEGTYAPDSIYRWMGSVAMDQAGDLAVGYSQSDSNSIYPSIAFAGRIPTDPTGALEAETEVIYGGGSQTGSPPIHRWGDYSAMTVDPVDDCTFWYTQEYIQTTGSFNWHTRIVNFQFPSCAPPYTLTVSTAGNGSGTVTSTDGFINCGQVCSHNYYGGTQVMLIATPAQGSVFTIWNGCDSTIGNTCMVTMNSSRTVVATFVPNTTQYTLSVSTSGNGTVTSTDGFINCPGTCSHSYLVNTPVTLNATPTQGWIFGGWNGLCIGTGSCMLTMNQPLSVDAIFSQALRFIAVAPCRLVDTRAQNGGGGPIQGGTFQMFDLPQIAPKKGCADLSTAAAYSLNVSVVPQGPLGYLTVWPTGENQPGVSTLNSVDGRVKANAAIVPAGANGAINIYASNTTDVILDIDGYFAPATSSTLAFYALPPCRVVDTRNPNGPLGGPSLRGGVERDFPVQSNPNCVIPSTAQAYSFNFTAVPVGGQLLGYLTVWPTGQTQPVVSTLNDLTGTVVANAAIVPAGQPNGEIAVFPSNNTDLVIDVNGYFAAPGQGGLSLYPAAPCRVLDTRQVGNGQPFVGELTVDVVDSICAPSSTAQAYVFNATVVPSGPLGYLTLWPDDGSPLPAVATLNAVDGAVTSNMAIVPTNNGKINAYASNLTQLILDISSYFAP
jgi:hypothetical protein